MCLTLGYVCICTDSAQRRNPNGRLLVRVSILMRGLSFTRLRYNREKVFLRNKYVTCFRTGHLRRNLLTIFLSVLTSGLSFTRPLYNRKKVFLSSQCVIPLLLGDSQGDLLIFFSILSFIAELSSFCEPFKTGSIN